MSSKSPQSSTMIGGQRMAARRRTQSEPPSGQRTNLPVDSGFQRHFGVATNSTQLGPQAVLLVAIAYMGVVVVMHIVSRIKTTF